MPVSKAAQQLSTSTIYGNGQFAIYIVFYRYYHSFYMKLFQAKYVLYILYWLYEKSKSESSMVLLLFQLGIENYFGKTLAEIIDW